MRNHRMFLAGSAVLASLLLASPGLAKQTGSAQNSSAQSSQSGAKTKGTTVMTPASQTQAAQSGSAPVLNLKTLESVLLSRMHMINQLEIKAGRMASKKGSRFDIRQLGDRLQLDHGHADQMVIAYANRHNLKILTPGQIAEEMKQIPATVPVAEVLPAPMEASSGASAPTKTPPDTRSQVFSNQVAAAQKMMERLKGLNGPAFDDLFTQFMVSGHTKAIAVLTMYRNMLPNNGIKGMLDHLIPVLEQHYDIAARLHIATVRRENAALGRQWAAKFNGK